MHTVIPAACLARQGLDALREFLQQQILQSGEPAAGTEYSDRWRRFTDALFNSCKLGSPIHDKQTYGPASIRRDNHRSR